MPACTTPQAKAKPTPLIRHLELLVRHRDFSPTS